MKKCVTRNQNSVGTSVAVGHSWPLADSKVGHGFSEIWRVGHGIVGHGLCGHGLGREAQEGRTGETRKGREQEQGRGKRQERGEGGRGTGRRERKGGRERME